MSKTIEHRLVDCIRIITKQNVKLEQYKARIAALESDIPEWEDLNKTIKNTKDRNKELEIQIAQLIEELEAIKDRYKIK